MTIEYKESKRIVALSTDTVQTLTYETDFSSNTGWTATGSNVSIDTSASYRVMDFNIPNSTNATDAITYDLTSTSDSAWVLRFKLTMSNFSANSTGHAKKVCIGLSSASHSTSIESSQDAIGILFGSWSSGTKIRSRDSDGGTWMDGSGTDFAETFADDEVYYVEIKRTSTTAYTVSLYSDSTYSTLIEAENETMASTVSGLRYIKVGVDTTTSAPDGTFAGNIDDMKFYNGVTEITSKPTDVQDNSILVEKDTARRYWFEANPLLDDNFSSDNFTHADTKTSVSNDKFNWEIELDNSDDTAYRSLGFTLDNSSWVMRFKINFATLATAGNPGAFGKFVLASTNAGQSGTFDWIGFERYVSSASNTWNLGYGENTSANTASDTFTTTPAASSTYYMELIRDGATITGKMFTGSDYSTGLVDTTTLSMSGTIENLSFFKFYNRSDNTNTSQTATGSLEDLKVWNGVTTASGGGNWTREGALDKTGLKAYWRFNETSGNIINQAEAIGSTDSISSVDLTTTGTTYNVSKSPMNYSLQFDGSNDYAKAGTSTSAWNFMHSTTAKWTVCFWADMTGNSSGTIMGDAATNNTNNGIQIICTNVNGTFRARVTDGGGVVTQLITSSGFVPQDNAMHFYKITYDQSLSSDNMKMSVDNGTNVTQTKTGNAPTNGNSQTELYIGSSDATNFFLAGEVAEMSIWSRVLTDAEVTAIYNSGSGVFPLF